MNPDSLASDSLEWFATKHENLLRFLGMWDDNIWFIPMNLKWIIYFFHSILRFECELPSPLKKNIPLNK